MLCWLGEAGHNTAFLAELNDPITEQEVRDAITFMHRGKACGPDRPGNDWYKDNVETLVPVLANLFNTWMTAGLFPASFLEAEIFCLKKGGEAANPLNYRPLPLLNSDYKVYTRVLANRTRAKMQELIHPNQNGFVPTRTIHETLDLFTVAQIVATEDPSMKEALALLLDFRKAYDSVDRLFLYDVLKWLGFPATIVAAIRAIYEGTTVVFIANGSRSRRIHVTCGIRQGCPLAPLLFLFVLEAFYRKIGSSVRVRGIVITSATGTITLKVAGFADDTAAYVRTAAKVSVLLAMADRFAKASGLTLNEDKPVIITLNAHWPAETISLPEGLTMQVAGKTDRYLGLQVG